jgi:hypothetical protein
MVDLVEINRLIYRGAIGKTKDIEQKRLKLTNALFWIIEIEMEHKRLTKYFFQVSNGVRIFAATKCTMCGVCDTSCRPF